MSSREDLYLHYMKTTSRNPFQFFSGIDEAALFSAMKEAEDSYKVWKETQKKLQRMLANS